MATMDVTEKNFESTVKQGIVMPDFWAIDRGEVLRDLDARADRRRGEKGGGL